jgi:adenylyltransferase/sulfurtransferase
VDYDAMFSRQRKIPHLGKVHQQKWREKKILVFGCGGLGNGVLMSMARMGFEHFVLVDGDQVSLSNLHRQWMFTADQVGWSKVSAAKEWLRQFAPQCSVEILETYVGSGMDDSVIPVDVDVVLDCTDQVAAKYWIEGFCSKHGIPWVMGSVEQWEGQVSVFEYPDSQGKKHGYSQWVGPGLKDFMVGTCEQRGVFPAMVQWIAQMQVLETCRICSGLPSKFCGRIGYWDMWNNTHLSVNI